MQNTVTHSKVIIIKTFGYPVNLLENTGIVSLSKLPPSNILQLNLRSSNSVDIFKNRLKTYFLKFAFSFFGALKSHALSYAISRSHADMSISHALALFLKVTLPLRLSEALMNSEFVPSLALNFGQCSICSCATNFLVSSGLSLVNI